MYQSGSSATTATAISFYPDPDPVQTRIEKLFRLLNSLGESGINTVPIIRELLQLHGFTPADIDEMLRPFVKVSL